MRVESAPLKGHPQGVPCAELPPQVTEGYFRVTLHIKQKIPQRTPPPSDDGSPPFSREAYLYIGSLEKGAGSRRLTEGFFRVTLHIKQKIPQNPSTAPFKVGFY